MLYGRHDTLQVASSSGFGVLGVPGLLRCRAFGGVSVEGLGLWAPQLAMLIPAVWVSVGLRMIEDNLLNALNPVTEGLHLTATLFVDSGTEMTLKSGRLNT